MSVLKCWTGGMVMLLALAGGVHAEMTVSQSNDANAAIGANLVALLGNERAAMKGVAGGRFQALVTPPPANPKRAAKDAISFDREWLASQPAAKGGEEFQCLATALYFEARGESLQGQAAVAEVILNRVDSASFPRTVCGVVNQSNGKGCQFSYTCDGNSDQARQGAAWTAAGKIARVMLDGAPRQLTEGATYFHTPAVKPAWSRRFELTAKIGRHIFYRAPIQTAAN